MQALKLLFSPMVFALGFLAPLITQSMATADVTIPGVPDLVVGLVVAAALGLIAQLRGGWLWHSTQK